MRCRCGTRGARRRGRRGCCCHRCKCLHGRFVRRQFGFSDRCFFIGHRWRLFIMFDLLLFLNLLGLYSQLFGRLRRCGRRWRRLFPSYRLCLIVCLVYYCLVFLFDIVVWAGRRCCGCCRCRHVGRRVVVATWWWRLWRRCFGSFFTLYFTLKYTLYISPILN